MPRGARDRPLPANEQRDRPETHRDDHQERHTQQELGGEWNAVERNHDASRSVQGGGT